MGAQDGASRRSMLSLLRKTRTCRRNHNSQAYQMPSPLATPPTFPQSSGALRTTLTICRLSCLWTILMHWTRHRPRSANEAKARTPAFSNHYRTRRRSLEWCDRSPSSAFPTFAASVALRQPEKRFFDSNRTLPPTPACTVLKRLRLQYTLHTSIFRLHVFTVLS